MDIFFDSDIFLKNFQEGCRSLSKNAKLQKKAADCSAAFLLNIIVQYLPPVFHVLPLL